MIYLEDRLLSEFTFGFELEAWADDESDKYKFEKWAYNYFSNVKGINPEQASMKDDSSIHPDDDSSYYYDNGECDYCDGRGYLTCPDCDGEGKIRDDCQECDNGLITVDCDKCNGTGKNISNQLTFDGEIEDCDKCNGVGKIEVPCPECNGEREIDIECPNCEGRGNNECENCSGV
jgi:hypothetical protein